MKLEEAIVDLLLRHNCVVVPAFGGFIAQSTGAVIDVRTGTISPPRKSVLFNRQLINNDGLLISHLSAEGAISYNEAEAVLTKHVIEWHTSLQEGKRVSIEKIGHLYLDAERNISFEQDRFFNLLLQSYGLNKVHFISEEEVKIAEYQHRPEKISVPVLISEEEKIDFSPREIPAAIAVVQPEAKIIALASEEEPKRRKIWKYAVAAALLPFAFYTYWIPMKTNVLESGMISVKDFNPKYQSGEGSYVKEDFSFPIVKEVKEKTLEERLKTVKTDVYSYRYDDDFFIPIRLNEPSVANKPVTSGSEIIQIDNVETADQQPVVKDLLAEDTKPKTQEKKKATVALESSSSEYIVGAYSSVQSAQAVVDLLKAKGLSKAKIVDTKNGLTRVSAGGSDNIIEMDAIVDKSIASGYKGWILN